MAALARLWNPLDRRMVLNGVLVSDEEGSTVNIEGRDNINTELAALTPPPQLCVYFVMKHVLRDELCVASESPHTRRICVCYE